jgi:hypothetical protein
MTQEFNEKFILTILDKGLLALVLAVAAFFFNRLLEKYKSQQSMLNEMAKQKQSFENELARQRDAIHLKFVERQLSDFYWPIYLRLQKDNVVWRRILDRNKGNDALRQKVGVEIERNFILTNHDEIVKIIESNIYLAKADDELLEPLLKYLKHIAVYKAMRAAGCYDKDPIHLQEPWPRDFFPVIEERTKALQSQYDKLLVWNKEA